MSKETRTVIRERDAGNGRFVKDGTHERRPNQTVRERVPKPGFGDTRTRK